MGLFSGDAFLIHRLMVTCWTAMMMLLTTIVSGQPGYIVPAFNVAGSYGFSGDGGPADLAKFYSRFESLPLSYDPSGGILIADVNNNRVRRVDLTSNIINTIAGDGTYGFTGDGGLATSASLSEPRHALYGPDGCLYIADYGNYVVRKVNAQGIISTIAGNGESSHREMLLCGVRSIFCGLRHIWLLWR
jgi:hypothetical protein